MQETSPDIKAAAPAPARESPAASFAAVRFRWPGEAFAIDVDAFDLARGERVLLLGPSGSGKSTFLSLLAGIAVPDSGDVMILGKSLSKLSSASRDRFRAEHFGIIFQMFNLLPYASLIDNVLLPLHFATERRKRTEAASSPAGEARRLLAALGLEPDVIDSGRVSRLSVGQQQRVAAARALVGAPEIIVADEPTSALDRDAQGAFLDLLFSEVRRASSSVIMVSHDESLGPHFDRVVRLKDIARISRERAA